MATGDIKVPQENSGSTYDEIVLRESTLETTAIKLYHGIQATGALSFDNSSHVLTMASGTNTYWFQGVKYTTANAITCDLDSYETLTTNTLYYFYFDDATGTLKCSDSAWNLKTQVPVATVKWNGSAGALVYECHNHTRDLDWHIWTHLTVGARYGSGLSLTAPTTASDAALQIESGTIYDEDITVTIAQQTTMRGVYMASAGVYTWTDYSLPYLGTSGQPKYLDTDTYALTDLTTNQYGCFWVYATPDLAKPIYVIPSHISAPYGTIAAARGELPPALNGMGITPEMKLLFKFIYKGAEFQEYADYRNSSTLPAGGTASTTAGAVSFSPSGNVAATTVQAAIEELDTEKVVNPMTASGDIIYGGTSGAPTRLAKGNDGQVLTLASGVPSWAAATDGSGGTSTPYEESFTATAGQTNFTLAHTPAAAWVWVSGLSQDASEWSISGNDIILANGAEAGDNVEIYYLTNASVTEIPKIWTPLSGAYASTSTFTYTGTNTDIYLTQLSLFTCTDSTGATRKFGYIKSSVNNSGTITATVVSSANLASGDKDFKVAYNQKVNMYMLMVSIPGEIIADTSYPQGLWLADIKVDSYLLPVDSSVKTAAAGSGAALTFNVYKDSTTLFSSAPDMSTNAVLNEQRPTTNTLSAGEDISLRIMSSAGATNKAADFQAKLYIVPQLLFTAFT